MKIKFKIKYIVFTYVFSFTNKAKLLFFYNFSTKYSHARATSPFIYCIFLLGSVKDAESYKEVTNLENQKILQKYLRYLFGITDLSISTIRIKLQELRTFLVYFNGE